MATEVSSTQQSVDVIHSHSDAAHGRYLTLRRGALAFLLAVLFGSSIVTFCLTEPQVASARDAPLARFSILRKFF